MNLLKYCQKQHTHCDKPHDGSRQIIGINRGGQVLIISDSATGIVPYVRQTIGKVTLRTVLPIAMALFLLSFALRMHLRLHSEAETPKRAAKLAAEWLSGCLQTADTIDPFCNISTGDAGLPAIIFYFQTCLDRESVIKQKVLNGQTV